VSLGYCLELLVELRHGPPPCRLAPLPHGLGPDRPRAIPPQHHRRRRKRHKDGQRTAQRLELITGPLLRTHTQGCLPWGHRWGRTSLGAPAHPPPPTDRSKKAQPMTLNAAFTTSERPTRGTAGPERRVEGTFRKYGCNDGPGQDTSQGPDGQDDLRACVGFVDRMEQTLHGWLILA